MDISVILFFYQTQKNILGKTGIFLCRTFMQTKNCWGLKLWDLSCYCSVLKIMLMLLHEMVVVLIVTFGVLSGSWRRWRAAGVPPLAATVSTDAVGSAAEPRPVERGPTADWTDQPCPAAAHLAEPGSLRADAQRAPGRCSDTRQPPGRSGALTHRRPRHSSGQGGYWKGAST